MKNSSGNPYSSQGISLVSSFKFWIATILLVTLYSSILFGQYSNTVFIDPTNSGDPDEDGSILHPYNQLSDFSVQSNTAYLIKRGTTMTTSSYIAILGKQNVKFGVYGSGDVVPVFDYTAGNYPIRIGQSSQYVTIDSLKVIGAIGAGVDGLIGISGNTSGSNPTGNVLISNCELTEGYCGIRALPYASGISNITIINTVIHNIEEDGIIIWNCPNVTIAGCNIYDINMDWHRQCHTESCAPGDCIQLVNDCLNFKIYNNILDRRGTGNKFCFIFGGLHDQHVVGEIIGNTFYPPIDTTDNDGGNALYLAKAGYGHSGTQHITVAYNKFLGRGYQSPSRPTHSLWVDCDTTLFYYNLFDSVGCGSNFTVSTKYVEFNNNTVVSPIAGNQLINFSGTPAGTYRNNLVAGNTSNSPIKFTNANLTSSNNLEINSSNTATWNQTLGINDWESGDYKIIETSPCTNAGYDYEGFYYDLDSTLVPQQSCRDIGAYEYAEGGQSNNAPVINNQSFDLDENQPSGQMVGVIVATDPDPGQTLTYSITAGNTENAFQINPSTGLLSINNAAAINFETNPGFNLTVKVQDNGPGYLSDQANISITLNDVNENPEIADQSFEIEENISAGSLVGIVEASDPDAGQMLSYSIVDGNQDSVFEIDPATGELTVIDNTPLNAVQTPSYGMTVMVVDNGEGALSASALVTVVVLEVNQPPVITDQEFEIDENPVNGSEVGIVLASDPNTGQQLNYSILSGNTAGAFQLDASTGLLTVSNSQALNFEINPVFNLLVEVQDNGAGALSDQATVSIFLNDVNETPEIEDQSFIVIESIGPGDFIGTVEASDPDNGQTLTFSITGGNDEDIFIIDPATGELFIDVNGNPDFSQNPAYFIDVQVKDNGPGELTNEAVMAISVDGINQNPTIENQDFSLAENCPNGTLVGTVTAIDPDAGQTLYFSIVSGNYDDAFSIDGLTGALFVINSEGLDYEVIQAINLVVEVEDDGFGNLTDQAVITVYLEDINEFPVISNQEFLIPENSPSGFVVAEIEASDPDAGQQLLFSILSGNVNNAFSLNSATGVLTVAEESMMNFESNPGFLLSIQVQDNGTGNLASQALITVNLTDINEPPVIWDQYFQVAENSPEGAYVGTVQAEDPDNGQSLTFSILSGNTQEAFLINPATGEITVRDSTAIDPSINPVFLLNVRVEDSGMGNLSAESTVVIAITGPTAVPELSGEAGISFSVFPNPVQEYVTIRIDNTGDKDVMVNIHNNQGALVYARNFSGISEGFEDKVNVSSWSQGVYFISTHVDNEIARLKLIKL